MKSKLIAFALTCPAFAGFSSLEAGKVIAPALVLWNKHWNKHGKGGEVVARRRKSAPTFDAASEKLASKATVNALDLIDALTQGAAATEKMAKVKVTKPKARTTKRTVAKSA